MPLQQRGLSIASSLMNVVTILQEGLGNSSSLAVLAEDLTISQEKREQTVKLQV